MTQTQVNELLAFAAAEISRHQAGVAIQGGAGVTVGGSGLEQTVSVHVPQVVTEDVPEHWHLVLFITISWTFAGKTFSDSGVTDRLEAGSVGRYRSLFHSTYAWQGTQFVYLTPDEDDGSFIKRDISIKLEVRVFDDASERDEHGDFIFERGSYRIPIEVTLEHIITSLNSPDQGKVVKTKKLIVDGNGTTYRPTRVQDNEWYELRLADIRRA